MFVGDQTFDEEMSFASPNDIRSVVEARMAEIAAAPTDHEHLEADAQRPVVDPGHAIEVPG